MQFSIDASTYTLKSSNKHYKQILRTDANYVIPIYQRPYSWNEDQLSKFISDLFDSFWGSNKQGEQEPMFIGTMQLSKKNNDGEQDIIDGQQRLTTFLLFLKALQINFPNHTISNNIELNWLRTEVNNGKQQESLSSALQLTTFNGIVDDGTNQYLENLIFINDLLQEEIKQEDDEPEFNVDLFTYHLFNHIYFVVIETFANLSKTLQIFDAINTTGLELNAGDVFKIRMYEYLNPNDENDLVFNEISALYEKIETHNKKYGRLVARIQDILGIYQFYLISKFNLPKDLYNLNSVTFYDRLFETLFNINKWEYFRGNVEDGKIVLSLEKLDSLIEARYEWEERWSTGNYGTIEDNALVYLWKLSRYRRYWLYTFLFLDRYKDDPNKYERLFTFTKKLVRLYYLYSIYYMKGVNEIKLRFNNKLVDLLIHDSYEQLMDYIDQKMNSQPEKDVIWFKNHINKNINYSSKVKNLLCRLSATLEENYENKDTQEIIQFREKLFIKGIDIEHIQSHNDEDLSERELIKQQWGDDLHSLGNLVALEYDINRKINNREHKKLANYKKSELTIVRDTLADNYSGGWNLEKCIERKEREVEKIMNYIFPGRDVVID